MLQCLLWFLFSDIYIPFQLKFVTFVARMVGRSNILACSPFSIRKKEQVSVFIHLSILNEFKEREV